MNDDKLQTVQNSLQQNDITHLEFDCNQNSSIQNDKDKDQEVVFSQKINSTYIGLLNPLQSLDALNAELAAAKDVENSGGCIDMNKSSHQKAKKRKHRPKVIVEDSAKKARKVVTPKKAFNEEKQLQKRKYVRKVGQKLSTAHSSVDLSDGKSKGWGKDIDELGDLPGTKKLHQNSCKRYMNFDLQGQEQYICTKGLVQMEPYDANMGAISTTSCLVDCEVKSDLPQDCTSLGLSDRSRLNVQIMKEIDQSNEVKLGLDSCLSKILEDHTTSLEYPNLASKMKMNQIGINVPLNGSGSNTNSISQSKVECITLEDMLRSLNLPLFDSMEGRKMEETNAEAGYDYSIKFPTIHKKKRTRNSKRCISFPLEGFCELLDKNCPLATEKDLPCQDFIESQVGLPSIHQKLLDNVLGIRIERRVKKKPSISHHIFKLPEMRIVSEENTKRCRKVKRVFDGNGSCMESLMTQDSAKVQQNICKDRHSLVEALMPQYNAKVQTKKRSYMRRKSCYPISIRNGMELVPLQANIDCNSSHSKVTSIVSVPSQPSVFYMDLMGELIENFRKLCLEDRMSEMGSTLDLYGGEKTLVAYEGHFMKKRNSRAKVDLDEETNRVWKLLMWKEGGDEPANIDEEKEKWWKEERRVFQGRAEAFIAKMHLVQGDRRFSKWKGSVVDSVVGVFLTQNVSDQLSSSAFMALAARFPLGFSRQPNVEVPNKSVKEGKIILLNSDRNAPGIDNGLFDLSMKLHNEPIELPSNNDSLRNNLEGIAASCEEYEQLATPENGLKMYHESPEKRQSTTIKVTGVSDLKNLEFQGAKNISPSVSSFPCQTTTDSSTHGSHHIVSSSDSNFEVDNLIEYNFFPSFTELLKSQIIGNAINKEYFVNDSLLSYEAFEGAVGQSKVMELEKRNSSGEELDCLRVSCPSMSLPNSHYYFQMLHSQEMHAISSNGYHLHSSSGSSGSVEQVPIEASGEVSRCSFLCNNFENVEANNVHLMEQKNDHGINSAKDSIIQENMFFGDEIADNNNNAYNNERLSEFKHEMDPVTCNNHAEQACASLGSVSVTKQYMFCGDHVADDDLCGHKNEQPSDFQHEIISVACNNLVNEQNKASLQGKITINSPELHSGQMIDSLRQPVEGLLDPEVTNIVGKKGLIEELSERNNCRAQKVHSNFLKHLETVDVPDCSSFVNQHPVEKAGTKSDANEKTSGTQNISTETTNDTSSLKKERRFTEKKDFDWDSLKRQVYQECPHKERSSDRMDSVDWDAVRCAEVNEISSAIRERGMNNRLAERIKDFLNRLVRDHGCIDLEWLREVPPDKAKEYLLSIWGLGLKSVECIRLLTLHHLAFPVDTNVGRICVRLGWVPLQPLPESLQLHLLDQYPVLESIQKYLWPRLCTLDQRTLYELHYQMITFGKVFCTKKQPNCNACPMRAECKHFASAFASARLALPCPKDKSIVSSGVPETPDVHSELMFNLLSLPPIEGSTCSVDGYVKRVCQPVIIEEPSEDESPTILQNEIQASDNDIEDAFWQEDPDEIPTIKLNIEEFTINVQSYVQNTSMVAYDGDISKALVALTPEAASIPMPKLKNVSRLRTEHLVYELPDSHPLLARLDSREPDDPCSYLLTIWAPGENPMPSEPIISCNAQDSGNLCDRVNCFTCNNIREVQSQTVRGTLLIPCRTAMKGSFPLNGTYFQVNEVFADADSSLKPINVPREWIWNLPRRNVYFGTSVPSIFRGLTTEGIQHCFWRGYVCVRGFDRKTRAPRPLNPGLHFPAHKLLEAKKAAAAAAKKVDGVGGVEAPLP